MFSITEYVPANEIWPTAEPHVDHGYIPSLVRGYNIEVRTQDGNIDWMSCSYIHEDPEYYFNNGYYPEFLADLNLVATGRICFRGYGVEYYDFEEREEFVRPVTDDDARKHLTI